ncbi:excalibur calcium-binding domain-containing protein [Altererythrobacter sp.]|uniref:excalibur calcium-binding domain-containing protein n=1 Tax=Altererythrobacter sp. TaxID=1872480 RepID=UPI003D01665C
MKAYVAGFVLIASVFGVECTSALAHPGGLASDGCHFDRKAGARHCHVKNVAAPPRSSAPAGPYYRNCDEARRAGVAPMRRGEPGYRPALDRDNDGIACEPYR